MSEYIVNFKYAFGDKVKCKHSGFIGTIVARMQFYNRCVQYAVMPKCGKDNKPEELYIDEQSLTLVKNAKKEKEVEEKEFTGGPNHKKIKRGF